MESWARMAAACCENPTGTLHPGSVSYALHKHLNFHALKELLEKVRRVKAAEERLPPSMCGPKRMRVVLALREARIETTEEDAAATSPSGDECDEDGV